MKNNAKIAICACLGLFCAACLFQKYSEAAGAAPRKYTIDYTFKSIVPRRDSKTDQVTYSVSLAGIGRGKLKKGEAEYQRGEFDGSRFEKRNRGGQIEYRSSDVFIYAELRPLLKYFGVHNVQGLKNKSFTSRYEDIHGAIKELRLAAGQNSKEAAPSKTEIYEKLAQALSRMEIPDYSETDIDSVQAAFDILYSCSDTSEEARARTSQWEEWLQNAIPKLNQNVRLVYAKQEELPALTSACGGEGYFRLETLDGNNYRMVKISAGLQPAEFYEKGGPGVQAAKSAGKQQAAPLPPAAVSAPGTPLKQRVRFYSIKDVKKGDDEILITGEGSSIANNGGLHFTQNAQNAAYPPIEVTVAKAGPAMKSCFKLAKRHKKNKESMDIQGEGLYADTPRAAGEQSLGVFKLTILTHCQPGAGRTLGLDDNFLPAGKTE